MAKPERDYHDFIDVFDPLVEAFFDAVDDVRHTALEEGWFGRQVTDDISLNRGPDDLSPEQEAEIDMNRFYAMPDFEAALGLDTARRAYEKQQLNPDRDPSHYELDIDR